jgi:hypothetical protein
MRFTTANGGCDYAGPVAVRAGNVQINWVFEDVQKEIYALTLFTLAPARLLTISWHPLRRRLPHRGQT